MLPSSSLTLYQSSPISYSSLPCSPFTIPLHPPSPPSGSSLTLYYSSSIAPFPILSSPQNLTARGADGREKGCWSGKGPYVRWWGCRKPVYESLGATTMRPQNHPLLCGSSRSRRISFLHCYSQLALFISQLHYLHNFYTIYPKTPTRLDWGETIGVPLPS